MKDMRRRAITAVALAAVSLGAVGAQVHQAGAQTQVGMRSRSITASGCGPTGGVRLYENVDSNYLNSQCIRYYNGTGNDDLTKRSYISLGHGGCNPCDVVGTTVSDVDTGGSNAIGYLTCNDGTSFNWVWNSNKQYVGWYGANCNDNASHIYSTQ